MGEYGLYEKPIENKIGVFDRRDKLFVNLGIIEKVNAIRQNRRKQKLEKALQGIIKQVNIIPRGFGSLPENKNISLNGYFNYKHPDLQGQEHTTLAKVLGIGNDQDTNSRLYAKAMQLIEDSFYNIRHLYQGKPELEVRAEEVRADLEKREKCEDFLRVEGYQEEIVQVARDLDKKFGAIRPDSRYKETAKSGIADVLDQAKNDLNLSNDTVEKVKVYLMQQDLYLVSRKKALGRENNNESSTRSLEERILDFMKEHEQGEDPTDSQRATEILKESRGARNKKKQDRLDSLKAKTARSVPSKDGRGSR